MTKTEITDFINRGTEEHPFGFIEFTDGLRIGYAPGARGADEDGLFNAQQPFLAEKAGAEIRASHVTAAREYVRTVLRRKTYKVTAFPEGEKFWVVRIDGLPEGAVCMTQALREKGEQDIEDMARDFVATLMEVDEKSFDLDIEIKEAEGEK
jgi:hypothetical protein